MTATAAGLLETLKQKVLTQVTGEGQYSSPYAGLCVHRYLSRTTFTKIPTLGVTLGVVLEGRKKIRFPAADLELAVEPGQFIVFTRLRRSTLPARHRPAHHRLRRRRRA